MAAYSSYKKINGSSIPSNAITDSKLSLTAFDSWTTKWIYGQPCFCSSGCCCLWTVPSGTYRVTFELWGAGGNGHGACSTSRCQEYSGAGGGYYNTKTISVCPGWSYTICAAGVYPCLSNECTACNGCASYVTGCNLSNFCAIGGVTGCGSGNWQEMCFSMFTCCLSPGENGGDFGMGNHAGSGWRVQGYCCHCWGNYSSPTAAPFIGTEVMQRQMNCWMRCGCWTVPYGHGGQGAMTNYCGSSGCCGQGGTGGPGLVKITYV
jgi:hypothetical protein